MANVFDKALSNRVLSIFEKTNAVGTFARQIEEGCDAGIDVDPGVHDSLEIANTVILPRESASINTSLLLCQRR